MKPGDLAIIKLNPFKKNSIYIGLPDRIQIVDNFSGDFPVFSWIKDKTLAIIIENKKLNSKNWIKIFVDSKLGWIEFEHLEIV